MSYQKSVNELKIEVLDICGELTDGSSPFDERVVTAMNNLYQGLLAGSNEFGVDIGEPWTWAQSKYPILLELKPYINTSVTLTNGSLTGTLSTANPTSLEGWYLQAAGEPDIYRIVTHSAGGTSISLDQPYIQDSGTVNITLFNLDYRLINDTIVINSSNNKLDFRESNSTLLTATITAGSYTPSTLCAAIKTQMESVGDETYTVSFDSLTRMFSIAHGGAYLDLVFESGTNVAKSISETIGFDMRDYQGTTTYTSAYALSGMTRISKPMTTYREVPLSYGAAKDAGKIFMIDDNTFLREYPLNRLNLSVPDKFCAIEQTPSGLWAARFNALINEPMRVEVNYIPVHRKLVDSTNCYPVVPGAGAMYLVYGAAYYILSDKSDNRADKYLALAQTKLRSIVNDARKNLSLGGNNYGRIIARPGQLASSIFNRIYRG